MTVSTFADDGIPDSRVLRLKSVDERGWAFASTASSVKGRQFSAHLSAALNFWWQLLVRSVRVRGPVVVGTEGENSADLAARSAAARAGTTAGNWRVWIV